MAGIGVPEGGCRISTVSTKTRSGNICISIAVSPGRSISRSGRSFRGITPGDAGNFFVFDRLKWKWRWRLETKKPEKKIFSGFLLKDWRRPTLAEPIGLLPSARQRLTAVFGMGTGRTAAVLPPKCLRTAMRAAARRVVRCSDSRKNFYFKERLRNDREFIEICTQESNRDYNSRVKNTNSVSTVNRGSQGRKRISNQAARPISTGRLNGLLHLHVQPIKRVVCPWSLGGLRPGKQYLGRSLALRCFQRLSLPHMATQRCP